MTDWRNRIVGYTVKRASELTANPANWRKHPQRQRDAVRASLNELGWIATVIENVRTGYLLDGHERVWQALPNDDEVPVLQVDLSEAEERLALATLDPLAALAETDAAALEALLREVNTGEAALQEMLAGLAAANGIAQVAPVQDAEPQINRADELRRKWGVQPGDLWALGDHRLICGDCTDAAVVARVLGNQKPLLMVTDPPYGVNYDPEWRNEAAEHGFLSFAPRRTGIVTNDDRVDWSDAYALFPGDVAYTWSPGGDHVIATGIAMRKAGFEIRNQIVWVKPHFPISRGHYTYQHEPCWYGVRKGGQAHWIGDTNASTTWKIALDKNVDGGHSTQKPLACMATPIANHAGDVYEPFSGSGTTIIACEQLGRRCYAVEISPAYVAVALERWATATGRTPELIAP